jgi:hypothetical protein
MRQLRHVACVHQQSPRKTRVNGLRLYRAAELTRVGRGSSAVTIDRRKVDAPDV